jgi:hypothetical protein
MNRLSFKKWLLNEMANYGFGDANNQILGGTDVMKGDGLFQHIKPNIIVSELMQMPPLGPLEATNPIDDEVQWGNEVGAIKVIITPLGSMKASTKRMTKDLQGNKTWILESVYPISDYKDENKEVEIANKVFDEIARITKSPTNGPDGDYEDIERLAQKLWHTTKKQHPSYIMFPTQLRKQRDNYYKLVYEFRGQGVGSPYGGKTGRAEQFDIDLVYYPEKGMIRCFGYDIESSSRERNFYVQPSEWDEYFSPKQDDKLIVENIVKLFLQY